MLLENVTEQFDPKFPISRRIDFFDGSVSWDTQTDPFPSMSCLRLFSGLSISLGVSEQTLVAQFASRFSSVIWTYGRMPKITRRIRTSSFEVTFARFLTFPSRKSACLGNFAFRRSSFVNMCLRFWSKRRRLCFLFTISSVAETARVST